MRKVRAPNFLLAIKNIFKDLNKKKILKLQFASQTSYENGSSMCTCCAVLWSIAMVTGIINDIMNEKHLNILMHNAQKTYNRIKLNNHNTLLQQCEVFSFLNLPNCVKIKEYYASDAETILHFECNDESVVDLKTLLCNALDNSAYVMTFYNHSIALYCAHTKFFLFDSLGSITKFDNFWSFWNNFSECYGVIQECTVTKVESTV